MAAFGVNLRSAPGTSFGEAETMEDLDNQVNTEAGADNGDEDGVAGGLIGWCACWGWVVGFGAGDEVLHGIRMFDTKCCEQGTIGVADGRL